MLNSNIMASKGSLYPIMDRDANSPFKFNYWTVIAKHLRKEKAFKKYRLNTYKGSHESKKS